jgi:hypothetical protein
MNLYVTFSLRWAAPLPNFVRLRRAIGTAQNRKAILWSRDQPPAEIKNSTCEGGVELYIASEL